MRSLVFRATAGLVFSAAPLAAGSCDKIFTPTRGLCSGLTASSDAPAFGGSSEFQRYERATLWDTSLFTACGEGGPACCVQFGSAWFRP